ncbi:MAG TPA: Trk system potassium transporter TrkA [Phycisphaerales bacterium]|nr:Trk system potassium transporter TrkA [Phycisphaerales bacterium]
MNIIICGAGEVGSHTAEVLAAQGHDITIIDYNEDRLRSVGELMDVGTLHGNATDAEILREAGAEKADLLVAATDQDEINLLTAMIAKAVGVKKTIARVHRGAFFEGRGLDYRQTLNIDQLICPEYSTATAIARMLRNPAALAIEHFAEGRIDMQEFPVSEGAPALDIPLMTLKLPRGTRLAAVARGKDVFVPDGNTVILKGDRVILVGNDDAFYEARRMFHRADSGKRKVVIMGGNVMAVWLCRALRERNWSIRLFETNRTRAEELAERLDWVTVIQADPTDRNVYMEENLGLADVFVGLLDDDEANIIGAVLAKSLGVLQVISVVQRPNYLDLLGHVGIDRCFSPRVVAAEEIEGVLDHSPLRLMASLAEGFVNVYRVRLPADCPFIGQTLREIKLGTNWVIAAIICESKVWVPTADDVVQARDTVLVVGRHGMEKQLMQLFNVK